MNKIIIALIVLAAGGIFFFFGKSGQKAEAPTIETEQEGMIQKRELSQTAETSAAIVMPAGQKQEIIVKANNWYFEPEEIRVKEGTVVKIILQGVSGTHTFAIPELGVKSEAVKSGETATLEFSADKKGEFSFKCALFCGEGHGGMLGKFIVE